MDVTIPINQMTLAEAKRSLLLQLQQRTKAVLDLSNREVRAMSDDEVTMHVRNMLVQEGNLDAVVERIQTLEP